MTSSGFPIVRTTRREHRPAYRQPQCGWITRGAIAGVKVRVAQAP